MSRLAERSSTGRSFFGAPVHAVVLRPALLLLAWPTISYLTAILRVPLCEVVATSQAQALEVREISPGSSVKREFGGGSSHLYEIKLASGQYARLLVAKGDVSLSAALFGPGGEKLEEFVSRRYGPLHVSVIAGAPGAYRLEVRSLEKAGTPGRYDLKVEEVRDASPQDASSQRAEKLFAEAERSRAEWQEQSLREAVQKYAEAREYWRAAAQPVRAAESLSAIGEVYFTLSEYTKALDSFKRALAARRAARDGPGEIQSLNDIGRVYFFLGNVDQALAYCQKVLEHYRLRPRLSTPAAEDQRGEAQALNNRGEINYSLGELKEALDNFERALGLCVKAEDRAGQALAHLDLGYAYADSGELEKASEHLQEALSLWRAVDDPRGEALARTAAGAVHSFLGEKQSALDSHKQALKIFSDIGDRQSEAVALNSIGQVYEDLNEPQAALDNYQLALKLYQENGSREFEAATRYYVGRIYRALGNDKQALAHYRKSLSLSRALGKRRIEAYAFTDISLIYASQGKKQVALDQFGQVLKVYRQAGDRRGQANALKNIGDIYFSLGHQRRAESYYERALSFSRQAGDRAGEAATLYDTALAERDGGQLAEALGHITESIKIIESLRVQIASPQLRASYFASVQKYYGLYISLLMRMHKLFPAAGHAATALQASESARARSLLETLLEAHADLRLGADPALLERERSLQQLLNAKAVYQMRLLNSQRTEADAEEIEKEIRRLTNEYDQVEAQISVQSPRYASLTQPQLLRLEDIQAELQDDETILLEYALGDEQSYLWAITAKGFTSYELPGRAKIEEAARDVYGLLTARQFDDESFADYRERVLGADEQYWQQAAALGRMLLGQVAQQLGGKRLLIVADGALQYIPFEALPEPAGPGQVEGQSSGFEAGAENATPMVLKHEIVYLPSASALAALRRNKARHEPAPNAVLVLADPVFERDDPRVGPNADAFPPPPEVAVLRRSLGDAGRPGQISHIPRLPSTLEEADAIMDATPWGKGASVTGFRANRATVMSGELGRYRIVHFATHGIINSEHPELSGIVLSMVNESGGQEDGFLQLHDIYGLKLSADLVVLSSCSTGLGKEIKGEGLVGLTRGFMYAGADSIVATLWKVDDKASAELMKNFYGAMLREGRTPAAALKVAKEKLREQKRWRAPFYWAAFVLQGEYKQSIRVDDNVSPRALISIAAAIIFALVLAKPVTKHFSAFRRRRRPGQTDLGHEDKA